MKNIIYRQTHCDLLRVFLVILVIIGHGTYYNITTLFGGIEYGTLMKIANIEDANFHKLMSLVTDFIYTFHMPVFIALSGSVYALSNSKNFKTHMIKKGKRLLIPFFTIWFVWNFPIKFFGSMSIFGVTFVRM
ncbi:MAG: acyltransferase family protein [Lachnospiraceae bacterium]|nr:acyltransferase family protein [Lachnospiraceae bacterium]